MDDDSKLVSKFCIFFAHHFHNFSAVSAAISIGTHEKRMGSFPSNDRCLFDLIN